MRQVLFWIPIKGFWGDGIPIYGFGTMLVVALFVSVWLAGRRAQLVGIAKEHIQDLALWVVIAGIVGARLVFMIQYHQPLVQFFRLWEGGLVFYGSLIGGIVGYVLAYIFVLRKHNISWRKVADVIAPSAAIGLAIGRVGCLLNGCCYGDVACPSCPDLRFPLSAYPRYELVGKGYQTAAGFTLRDGDDPRSVVDKVEPGSAAEKSGLRSGDQIVKVDGKDNKIILQVDGDDDVLRKIGNDLRKQDRNVEEVTDGDRLRSLEVSYDDLGRFQDDFKRLEARPVLTLRVYDVLWDHLVNHWPRGDSDLTLTVKHEKEAEETQIGPFVPRTLGLHPTQVYESISTGLLFLLLTAYYPFRRHDGEVFALFLICYPIHRFLNEWLRNDTADVKFGMTLSQNGSLLVLAAGIILMVWLLRQPAEYSQLKTA